MQNLLNDKKIKSNEKQGKYEKFIRYQISLNLEIETNFLKQVKFKENLIEEQFQEFHNDRNKIKKVLSDIVIIIGYVASIIYIIFAYYRIEFLLINLFCLLFSLIYSIFSYKDLIPKEKIKIFTHLNTLLIALMLAIKCFIVCLDYNTIENDNEQEILRLICYYSFSINLFIVLKFESNMVIYLFYFGINIGMIIVSSIKSNKNHYYYLDGLMDFFISMIFWTFRKVYDYLVRKIFAEKYKFEKYFNYTIDFMQGLNSFYVNYENDIINFIDPIFEVFLTSANKKFNLFENPLEQQNINFNLKSNNNVLIKDGSFNKEESKLNNSNYLHEFDQLNKNHSMYNSYKTEKICLNEFTKHLIIFKDNESLNNSNNLWDANEPLYKRKQFEKFFNSNEKNYFSSSGYIDGSLYSILQMMKSFNLENDKVFNNTNNINKSNNNSCFIKLGIFSFKNEQVKKFYEVNYRRINTKMSNGLNKINSKIYCDANNNQNNNNFQYDLLFYDVSELILSKKIIYEENIIKQKIEDYIRREYN